MKSSKRIYGVPFYKIVLTVNDVMTISIRSRTPVPEKEDGGKVWFTDIDGETDEGYSWVNHGLSTEKEMNEPYG